MSAPTYVGTIDTHHRAYRSQLTTRSTQSFNGLANVPWNYILLGAYLILANKPTGGLQYLTFLIIMFLSFFNILWGSTKHMAYGLVLGISISLCVLMSANLLLLDRPLAEFQRRMDDQRAAKQIDTKGNRTTCKTRWQSRPDGTHERLFWTLDYLRSLRGLHWSHGNLQDSHSDRQVLQSEAKPASPAKVIGRLLLSYLSIDVLKEFIAMDPYFWGFTDAAPPEYVASVLQHAELVKAYRMIVASAVFFSSIELVCAAGELIFVHVLGPSIASTRGEQWAYQPQFGDFEDVYTKGLRGFWGHWWHQMFRLMLTLPAAAIMLKSTVPKGSTLANVVRLTIPFLISGVIHACGSYTLWGVTRLFNAFLFFALQPPGIALESIAILCFGRSSLAIKIPRCCLAMINVLFTSIWLLKTFPLLVDDYSKGGFWLTEPFPFSLLQKIGLGSDARSHLF